MTSIRHICILFIVLLFSCASAKRTTILQLLPQPQQIKVETGLCHKLTKGNIVLSSIQKNRVNSIPEAKTNQEEAYRLQITPDSIYIEATTERGVFWAEQTLRQIVASSNGKAIPCCRIVDYPAFRIRGFMHDVGRSFISVPELKKQISLLSQFKINTFHWHLTENQAWRIQSRIYPQLTDKKHFTRFPDQYYTIEDAKEIADWCKKHKVLLIPEIDMPGHSEAFKRAIGVDMQSEKGMKVLKNLMTELCTEIFADVPYIHIGTDEVNFTNPDFVPQMVQHIRALGKKVISWNPGWKYQKGEIDMTQLWSYRGKAQAGIPAIDSRFHYINHFDVFGDIVALYNSKIYHSDYGSNDLAGTIIGIWNDRKLSSERDILSENNFYPSMLAIAERSWKGGGNEYFDKNGVLLPTDSKDSLLQSFIDFEKKLTHYKNTTFKQEPFPYIAQTHIKWLITDPFPNKGDLKTVFPPETHLSESYSYNDSIYQTHIATGAGIYLRHVWGKMIPAFYKNPQENSTAYAYTWVHSPQKQTVGLRIEFQNYSRSESDLPPPQGKWDYRESRIWINDKEVMPPVWQNSHFERSNEITLKNENAVSRPPITVDLKKGWNKVLLKLPVGKFSTPEIRLVKWSFTCIFVTQDGRNGVDNLIYNPWQKK